MSYIVNGHNVFFIIIITLISSFFFVWFMKKTAIYLDILDKPISARKIQKEPVPLLGGIGIFLSFLLGYMLFAPKNTLMLSILISSFLIVLLGLFDDFSKNTKNIPNKIKVIVQIICACIVVFYGGLDLSNITLFGYTLELGIFSKFIAILIVVAIINAINLIDGLDGLCAGISSIYFLTIAVIGFILNKFGGLDIILCLIMLGSTLGYLIHNFPPAKIYQGDAGSTFLGLMIAVIFLLGFKTMTLTSLIIPLLILAIPILDTLFAIIRRKLKGQSIDTADKEHIHHQLLKHFSKKSSLLVIYAVNMLFSITTIFYVLGDKKEVIICYIFLVFIVLFLVLKTNVIFDEHRK